ncbi:hypothetical protein [Roseospirillum parvum]|uniref:DUF4376 domain-containing protein n=1 Tax=Roseospirillum parvum TaxID=83401 RepID=A0A1G8G141_9PROT|nr:hypothetical protein [Roseospirillum parvum]SDH88101.1 hypothetical protein SAMN05421742_1189 [Roseospirillum parvum]
MTLYMRLLSGEPQGLPQGRPSQVDLLDGTARRVGCAHWPDDTLAELAGWHPVVAEYDPRLVVATGGGTWDAESGLVTPATSPIPDLRERLCAEVDAAAEAARNRYLTPGSGQALTYQRKEAAARACLSAHSESNPPDPADWPMLACDIPSQAGSVLGAAQTIIANADAWEAVAAQIEAIRLAAKTAIRAAVTDAEALAIPAGLEWP